MKEYPPMIPISSRAEIEHTKAIGRLYSPGIVGHRRCQESDPDAYR
jgi:hypothetical protein